MLEERSQEAIDPPALMAELSGEFPLVVFEAEGVALELVLFEDAIQFGGSLPVENEARGFIVPFEGTRIHVDAADH